MPCKTYTHTWHLGHTPASVNLTRCVWYIFRWSSLMPLGTNLAQAVRVVQATGLEIVVRRLAGARLAGSATVRIPGGVLVAGAVGIIAIVVKGLEVRRD